MSVKPYVTKFKLAQLKLFESFYHAKMLKFFALLCFLKLQIFSNTLEKIEVREIFQNTLLHSFVNNARGIRGVHEHLAAFQDIDGNKRQRRVATGIVWVDFQGLFE